MGGVMARHKALTWAGSFRSEVDNWRHPPLALVLWPKRSFIRDICLVLAGSLFVALLAQIVIPLPFTPVPITGQTFAVVLTGALLGSKRGPFALLAYLAEGGIGLPFFTGGASG